MPRNFGLRSHSHHDPMVHWILRGIGWALVAFVLVVGVMLSKPRAHEWYPAGCCSGTDCAPIEAARVKPEGNGYVIDGRFTVAPADVKESLDGRYHACFPQPETLGCFFAPKRGM